VGTILKNYSINKSWQIETNDKNVYQASVYLKVGFSHARKSKVNFILCHTEVLKEQNTHSISLSLTHTHARTHTLSYAYGKNNITFVQSFFDPIKG